MKIFTCCYCKEDFPEPDVRPYGPGGAMTCYTCGLSTENLAMTKKMCAARLAACGPDVVFTPTGPVPAPANEE